MVLEILCATPKPPRIPKPAPQPVPRLPLPPPASDQVTLTQYSRHRRSSLLPLAPALKRPCPTPQYGSLLQRRASQSAPPPERPQFGSLLPAQAPPATSTDFGETFQFPALRQVCTGRVLHIGHSFISNLPLEARKCVLGLDRRVSDADIRVGPAPTPTRSSLTHCAPPSRRSSPSVPGHSAPTRVVVYPPTHLLRAAEPQEFLPLRELFHPSVNYFCPSVNYFCPSVNCFTPP